MTVPRVNRALRLGTWQSIYLCKHRNYLEKYNGNRKVIITVNT
ncbi:YjbQ family protein [Psychrobacter sp. N25K4-3-2]|nr:YjbQ family protein [Psychrobacter sp. N25K4-3-2]